MDRVVLRDDVEVVFDRDLSPEQRAPGAGFGVSVFERGGPAKRFPFVAPVKFDVQWTTPAAFGEFTGREVSLLEPVATDEPMSQPVESFHVALTDGSVYAVKMAPEGQCSMRLLPARVAEEDLARLMEAAQMDYVVCVGGTMGAGWLEAGSDEDDDPTQVRVTTHAELVDRYGTLGEAQERLAAMAAAHPGKEFRLARVEPLYETTQQEHQAQRQRA